jgi:hypothetical protein
MGFPKWLGRAFLGVGAILIVVSLGSAGLTLRFVHRSARATGNVVGMEESDSGDGRTFHPVVRFAPASGFPREFRSSFGANPPSYRVGDEVRVLYDPADPGRASIDSFLSLWFVPLLTGIMGPIALALGLSQARPAPGGAEESNDPAVGGSS